MTRREVPAEYRQGPIEGVQIRRLTRHSDRRGWLVELYREDEMATENRPVMAYVSETLPGVVRGPHEHLHQGDHLALLGPGDFRLYFWDARPDSPTLGNRFSLLAGESQPQSVTIPPGIVHAYQNVSDKPGWVFNAPNRLYAGRQKSERVDEIRHEEDSDSPFQLF